MVRYGDKMKTKAQRLVCVALLSITCHLSSSCMTAYDAYGRPIQVVDPAVAAAGMVAAGAIGYAVANNNNNNYGHYGRSNYFGGGLLPVPIPYGRRYARPYTGPRYGRYAYNGPYAPRCAY